MTRESAVRVTAGQQEVSYWLTGQRSLYAAVPLWKGLASHNPTHVTHSPPPSQSTREAGKNESKIQEVEYSNFQRARQEI